MKAVLYIFGLLAAWASAFFVIASLMMAKAHGMGFIEAASILNPF